MAKIYNYNGIYESPDGPKPLSNEGKHISLYNVMKLRKLEEKKYSAELERREAYIDSEADAKKLSAGDDDDDDDENIEWESSEHGKLCLVFFNKEAMKFFAIAQGNTVGLATLNIPKLNLSEEAVKSFTEKGIDLDLLGPRIFTGKNIEEIKKNVETLRKEYETLKPAEKGILYPFLHKLFELTADIQLPYENYKEMDNLFKDVSSTVKVPRLDTNLETVKLPTADITSSSSHGSTGWSKMKGGAVSSEIASILHLLEYNNTVNNNFVNNVLPTLKGGNLNDINWELEHFITNSQNNEKLFNTITNLAKNAQSEPLKVYLRKLRYCIARAQGISHILKNNNKLLNDKSPDSKVILQKIRDKIGKYTTDLKKKEEAAKKGITITITSS